jgi:hypothetical protein
MIDEPFEALIAKVRAHRAAELIVPIGGQPAEDPVIALLSSALHLYGKANDVEDDNLSDFVNECFELIDNGPVESYAFTDEDRAYAAQKDVIIAKYGQKAYENCNSGWAVSGDDESTTISTKIYVRGRPVLSSTINHETKEITHDWE